MEDGEEEEEDEDADGGLHLHGVADDSSAMLRGLRPWRRTRTPSPTSLWRKWGWRWPVRPLPPHDGRAALRSASRTNGGKHSPQPHTDDVRGSPRDKACFSLSPSSSLRRRASWVPRQRSLLPAPQPAAAVALLRRGRLRLRSRTGGCRSTPSDCSSSSVATQHLSRIGRLSPRHHQPPSQTTPPLGCRCWPLLCFAVAAYRGPSSTRPLVGRCTRTCHAVAGEPLSRRARSAPLRCSISWLTCTCLRVRPSEPLSTVHRTLNTHTGTPATTSSPHRAV